MLFHTIEFLLFFTLLYAGYRVLPAPHRPTLLLAGSIIFYGAWRPVYLLLLISAAAMTHFSALRIARGSDGARRGWLTLAVSADLALLTFFKYAPDGLAFTGQSGAAALVLPIGISFYTFQLIAYLVDVFRGTVAPVSRFRETLLFAAYFPQLISGPIERASRLLPRLLAARLPGRARTLDGLRLAAWGFFKKLFVADNLAILTGPVFDPARPLAPGEASLYGCVFALQLYADFSGYVDIARGLSRMLGIELSANFRRPLEASGPAEFWRRWHVTLYAFFRDYVYRPMGGNRHGTARAALNIMIVFTLGGIWHGAGWPFPVWGLYCGLLVLTNIFFKPTIDALARAGGPFAARTLGIGGIAFSLLSFAHGLLLFQVESVDHARALIQSTWFYGSFAWPDPVLITRMAFFSAPLFLIEFALARPDRRFRFALARWPAWAQGLLLCAGAILLTLFGSFGAREYYYFQF